MLFDFLYEGLSGFVFACLCLAVLLFITILYIGKYERERDRRQDMLDKQELYRRLREDKWARIADGLSEWEDV
jgi:hypothetical protein